ncbi:murinoglobulin-1 [Nephila pilipes]|uniref:TEP1-F n=1 Tax=Nephila pilipes TaxID=299642 RepID=A0A8X6ILT6_NEPPI|nr:murinoglobulin-1 [Nephila pilipes]
MLGISVAQDELDRSYIFTSPRTLKTGSNNQLQLLRFGCLSDDVLKVQLFYTPTYDSNETLLQEANFKLGKAKKDSFLAFYVPHTSENLYNGRLQINGTICGSAISGSDSVSFSSNSNQNIILIQTDKPLYKPGQEVQFRVLKFDNKLKPSNRANDTADVYVEDPKGTRLFQFNGINLGKGIQQMQFPLADEPALGSWTITVSNGKQTQSATFDVKEYSLPKFDVSIDFPPYVLTNAKTIPVKVCAKYTYGEPVQGTLNLNSSLEIYSYSYYSYDSTPVIQNTVKIDGCYNYNINVSEIDPDNYNTYRRIMVVANVIEDGTGVQINATNYLSRTSFPLNLNFDTDANQEHYYKPGLPYIGKLQVSNPDDSPAQGEPIEICATVSRKRIIAGWQSQKTIEYCKNYTSNAKGLIKYAIEPQNVDSISIELNAKSLKYARSSNDYSPGSLNQPTTFLQLEPFYSPSGSFLQLSTVGHPIPCDTQKNIKVLFTSKENTEFILHYQVISQGKVVTTGAKDVTFNVEEDDVSEKFQNDNDLINGSETEIVPEPDSTSSSSESSEDDEYCPGAGDARYTPPIGEVHIPIQVNTSLSPSFTLLVFYVRKDRETVADSEKIEVEKCFQNKVNFEFGDEEKQPGSQTTVRVTSSPSSLCGLKIVDKSVSLLDSSDQLTKDRIFQLLDDLNPDNYFYSPNPCYRDIPQPGLPPSKTKKNNNGGPSYSSSSYEDSYSSFQDAGYLVISNLILFSRPCSSNGVGYGPGVAYGPGGPGPEGKPIQIVPAGPGTTPGVVFGPAARGAAGPGGPGGPGGPATTSVKDVRDYFPETWLFQLEMTNQNGVYMSEETLPDTVTEWEGSAVCINQKDGLGLSNTTSIRGFQAFFISYTLPISVIRGEEFVVVVSIFSYVDAALPVTVTLEQPKGFVVANDSTSGEICVQPNTSNSIPLTLKATTVGEVNITVRAETASSSQVCGSSPVYGSYARDAITQSFEVEAEGFPNDDGHSILFCPSDKPGNVYRITYNLVLPNDVVPDSARAFVDITGNVLGPTIQNLNDLVALPTGCGEQNMVKFTPNYLVLDYLSDIGKLTEDTKSMAIRNLNTGYQRELNYRHNDGSFSAFGKSDKQGSMFLTAFVLRSFYEAQRYITIDNNVLTSMEEWITKRQRADGCFPNIGQIIDSGIQGGLNNDKNVGAITAYVAASLLISKYSNQNVITNAMTCLNNHPASSPYETFLYAYAEALNGDNSDAEKRIDDIKPRANTEKGLEYYRNPNGTQATNIETAAYAVLANLQLGNSKQDVLPLVRYLTMNLNPRGGFYSTQDTVVGLHALSNFAKLVYEDPVNINVTISGGLDEKVQISEDNKLLVQRNMVSQVPSKLKLQATGQGCGLFQTSLRYHTNTPPENQKFFLQVTGECKSADCKQRKITTIVSYLPTGKIAGMSVVQIKMLTGISPVRSSINQLTSDPNNNIIRADVEDNTVNCYFEEISNNDTQFSFEVEEVVQVVNPQPGTAKVFDYYAPENSASTSYTFGDSA